MIEAPRITAEEARKRALSGEAMLVCAYLDDERCKKIHLDGAIFYGEFQKIADSLPKEREIIFYCT